MVRSVCFQDREEVFSKTLWHRIVALSWVFANAEPHLFDEQMVKEIQRAFIFVARSVLEISVKRPLDGFGCEDCVFVPFSEGRPLPLMVDCPLIRCIPQDERFVDPC